MQPCPVPILATRILQDLERIRSGSNVHRVSNYRMIARGVQLFCHYPDCPGPDACTDRLDNLRALNDLRARIVAQWRDRYRGKECG